MKKYILILGLLLGSFSFVFGQIPIWLPDTTVAPGEELIVPIYSGLVTTTNPVYFYQTVVYFDPAIITAVSPGYNYTGCFTPVSWITVINLNNPDSIGVGAFSAGDYLVGEGALVNLMFQVDAAATGVSPLNFFYFMYAEPGFQPEIATTNGSVTVVTAAPPAVEDLVISVDIDNIILDWGIITAATSYNIYRYNEPYYTPTTVYMTTNTNTYIDEDAMLDGPWFYVVTASN